MLKSKSFLCIDFGATTVKVAEFEPNETGSLRLKNYALRSMGQLGFAEEERETVVLGALKEILADGVQGLFMNDEEGRPRGTFRVTAVGPELSLNDERGKTRARIDVTNDMPEFTLGDKNGQSRVGLVVTDDTQGLFVKDNEDNIRIRMLVTPDGPNLNLTNSAGQTLWDVPVPAREILD